LTPFLSGSPHDLLPRAFTADLYAEPTGGPRVNPDEEDRLAPLEEFLAPALAPGYDLWEWTPPGYPPASDAGEPRQYDIEVCG
jgi:hypothetical protein